MFTRKKTLILKKLAAKNKIFKTFEIWEFILCTLTFECLQKEVLESMLHLTPEGMSIER